VSSLALIALLAEAAAHPVYGPQVPPKPQPKVAAAPPAADRCADQRPRNDREIVVCAPRSDGYRLNPDVIEAKREAKNGGNRTNPPPSYKDTTACGAVGPFGCTGTPAINLIAVGMVLATMARRAATGGNVGAMFVTPQKSEYDLYVEAKARREAKERAAAAAQIAEAARARAAKPVAKPVAAAPPNATTAAP
jgi:hypothetical protein